MSSPTNALRYYLRPSKIWQIVSAALAYFFFGLGAVIVGVFFKLLSPLPVLSASRKQTWIRWCIHKGCLTFIIFMRVCGLIRYQFDLNAIRARPGHIMIANHPTLLDVVMLFAVNPQMCCFVKGAVWDSVFTGTVVRLAGFIPNNTIDAITMAQTKLDIGESLLIFPEGTRTQRDKPLRFKRGASNIAVVTQAPIMPILIKSDPPALKKGDKWYRIPDGGVNFLIEARPSISIEECIDTSKPNTLQYRLLTQYLEQYYQSWLDEKHKCDVNETPQ